MHTQVFAVSIERPAHLQGGTRNFSVEDIAWVASQFQIDSVVFVEEFGEKGNINLHTYLVRDVHGHEYLLQRINTDVFVKPNRVMSAMEEWIESQKRYLESDRRPDWTIWQPITLVSSRNGDKSVDLSDGTGKSVWRLMLKIQDSVSYKSLSAIESRMEQLAVAEELGRGLALSADFASEMPTENLVSSLPGYRDTLGYYNQLKSVLGGNRFIEQIEDILPENEEVRESTQNLYLLACSVVDAETRRTDPELQEFIKLAIEAEPSALALQRAIQDGRIRETAIHGDTKIENFLFCYETGRVRCLVDLDTIMPHSWLADWGDMMRSLVNVAGEKETDRSKIQVDREVYAAVTKGFLQTASECTQEEIDLMASAVEIITLELGVRFLADYLRGDNYFCLGANDPADLNKIRAIAQLTLYQRLRENHDWAKDLIVRLTAKS